jgi:hypothetical protein
MVSGASPVFITTRLALRPTPTAPAANTTDAGTVAIDCVPLPFMVTVGLGSAGRSLLAAMVTVADLLPCWSG